MDRVHQFLQIFFALNEYQKNVSKNKNLAEKMLAEITNDSEMFKRIITRVRVKCYQIETNVQSSQWTLPGASRSKKKKK